ncbi:uncharacterized protein I303_108509 [Kwoniella dejecticola CBS 10117]|uniref:non-specific serine/threonine protein kinase n=1 Tax=Kwoniella dejecticola CBS 10117 TaxID=1296121 RepID=A0A1A5ZX72_9TREE|nr:CAMK/CAMKL/CHK1 protein kinase [Kwoniella dejecticola CBS 10117]OBR82408.1 CAMK/CAMKL/CHK1 protein kinase [Kwoniella dejecticola CBS 10117]
MNLDDHYSQLRYPVIHGYRIGEEIGGGGFSKVFRAIDDAHSSVAACKVVNLFISPTLGYGTPNIKELQKEVQVHKALKHDYILQFIHSEVVDQTQEQKGWVPGLYMVLELAVGGDLFDKIAPDVGVPEDLAKFYFAQLASGMEFIHEKGIAHRDLKPENLLLAANGNLKISDFGLCAVFRHKGKTRLLSGRCGSLPYVAPELGNPAGQGYAAEPVDIWGMGVVLYTLLVGNTPWDEPSDASPEFCAYKTGELLQYPPWDRITGQAKSILLAMLTIDPNERITMQGLKTHRWSMTPSQLRREQIPEALTLGMTQNGMMDVINPVFNNPASQAYVASQRVKNESQWGSQFNQQESQFMRMTGNITQSGALQTITTRFWLNLNVQQSFELLSAYMKLELGQENVRANAQKLRIEVVKPAGAKTIRGTIIISEDTEFSQGELSLVLMRKGSNGSILHWKAFWWTVVRSQQLEPYIVRGDE